MGTSATIGYFDKNTGEVTASYCHYDGYPEGVGNVLNTFYSDAAKAEEIANIGYMSSLQDTCLETYIVAVNRDDPTIYSNVSVYLKSAKRDTDYVYLYDGEAWFVTATNEAGFTDVVTTLEERVT